MKHKLTAGAAYLMQMRTSSYYEVKFYKEDGSYYCTKDIPVSVLMERGIITRSDSFKKVDQWLNSEEGMDYVLKECFSDELENEIKEGVHQIIQDMKVTVKHKK